MTGIDWSSIELASQTIIDLGGLAEISPPYAGMDCYDYPGDVKMKWLWDNTNLYWTGYYLTHYPGISQKKKTSWIGTRSTLQPMGWGIAPIYVGQQDPSVGTDPRFYSNILSTAQGTTDANEAITLASNDGFPQLTAIFLDVEGVKSATLSAELLNYINGWVSEILKNNFVAGIYTDYTTAGPLNLAGQVSNVPLFWVARWNSKGGNFATPFPRPDPGGCGLWLASAWQLQGECTIPNFTTQVDLDTADTNDPCGTTQTQ